MTDEELQGQQDEQVDADDSQEDEKSLEEKLKECVGVKIEDVSGLRKKITVTVPADMISEQTNSQYDELRRDATVPGFRRGRAPRRLLERRFATEVSSTLSQQLVSTSYMAAVDKEGLKIIGDPLVWVSDDDGEKLVEVSEAIEKIKLPEEGDLTYSCEIELRPEFDLPELENIPVEKPIIMVEDANIDEQLARLQQMRGTYEPQEGGTIEADDIIKAQIQMTCGGDVLKEQEAATLAARPQTIDGVSLDKLGEDLAGAKVGDVRKVSGEIGDDYFKQEYRGKTAEFEITIGEILRVKLPELDDDFVKSIGFEKMDELRDYVRKDLESRVDQDVKRAMQSQVRDYLLKSVDFELPTRLSERQTARVITQRMMDMYRQGVPPTEAEKQMDEVKSSAKEEVARDLKLAFVMEKLAEDNDDIQVTEAEINGQIAQIAQYQGARFDVVRDQLVKGGGLETLYVQIRDEKLIDRLLEKAKVTEKAPEKEKKDDKKGG